MISFKEKIVCQSQRKTCRASKFSEDPDVWVDENIHHCRDQIFSSYVYIDNIIILTYFGLFELFANQYNLWQRIINSFFI